MLFVDHGVIRAAFRNRHHVAGELYRSSQPAPRDVRAAARLGIRTIINLRGRNDSGHYHLEWEAASKAHIALEDFPIKSRRAPPREMIMAVADLFERIEYPALLHCKSGIDRAGLISAVFILCQGGNPPGAITQFDRRYLYVPGGQTGIGKAFIEAYARAWADSGIGFLTWVRDVYDPERLSADFTPNRFSTALVNFILHRE